MNDLENKIQEYKLSHITKYIDKFTDEMYVYYKYKYDKDINKDSIADLLIEYIEKTLKE